MVAKMLTDI